MKRKPYKTITLFNVVAHSVYINDKGREDHFTLDSNEGYFDWSDDLETKLKEYNDFKFTSQDVGEGDGVEKVLWCAEVSAKMWKKYKNHEDMHEYISNEVDYDFKILKSKYFTWLDLLSDEDLAEYKANLKELESY